VPVAGGTARRGYAVRMPTLDAIVT